MRIAFFVSGFPVRSETFILTQIAGLIDRGHDVDIWANQIGGPQDLHGDFAGYGLFGHVHRRRRVCGGSRMHRFLARLRLLCQYLFAQPSLVLPALNVFRYGKKALSLDLLDMALCLHERPVYDVVHCHFGPNGNDAALLMDFGVLRGKLVTTFHSYDVQAGIASHGRIYRRLARRIDAVHSISEFNRRWLESFGFDPRRIHYHPMAIDTSRFAPRRRCGRRETVALLTVARLAPEKGFHIAFAAIASLRRRRPELRLEYRIIGGGPLQDALKTQARERGLDDIVELVGARDQVYVRAALQESDIFLLPSVQEALPIAIMEAMASALPVVATDVGGVGELVRDGETGRLVPSGDPVALEAALTDLIDGGEAVRNRVGRRGRSLVADRHDNRVVVDRLVEHYQGLVRDRGTQGESQHEAPVYSRS